MKRIFLFLVTNIAVLLVLSVTASILIRALGIEEMPGGLNIQSLIVFAAVLGFGGSFISLAMTLSTSRTAMLVATKSKVRFINLVFSSQ